MGKHKTYDCGPQCLAERAFEPLMGKWKVSIVFLIQNQPMRFNSLLSALPGVSTRILTKQLKEMEDDQILDRFIISEKPIAVEYALTEHGKDLLPIMDALITWRGVDKNRLIRSSSRVDHPLSGFV